MFVRKYITLFFFTFCILFQGFAQKEELQFRIYGFEEGLSHRNVFKIHQDYNGYIWAATFKGLNRFDGRKFLHYKSENPTNKLIEDFVGDFTIAPDSIYWLAGHLGLSALDPFTNRLKEVPEDASSEAYGKKELNFSDIFVDETGQVWVITQVEETHLSYLQMVNEEGKLHDVIACDGVFQNRALAGRDKNIMFSYAPGKIREVDGNGSWTRDYTFSSTIADTTNAWVTDIQVNEDGTIWALLDDGHVFTLGPSDSEFRMHPMSKELQGKSNYNGLLVEKNGDVWVVGVEALLHYEKASKKVFDYNEELQDVIKNNINFRQIIEDESGVIWVASDYGAIKMVRSKKIFSTYLDGGSEYCQGGVCSARGITSDEDGNVYISYYNSIHILQPETNTVRPLFRQSSLKNPPFGLLHHRNALWSGAGYRIDLERMRVDTLFKYNSPEGVVALGAEGQLWFGNKKKLLEYDIDRRKIKTYRDPKGLLDKVEDITFLLPSRSENRLWVATKTMGIILLDKEVGSIAHYSTDSLSRPRLSSNRIIGLYEDSKGILWVASAEGVNQIDPRAGTNKVYKVRDGLPNDFINGLLPESENVMWFSTDNGLSRFDIAKDRFDNFTTQDGLSKNEFNRISFHKTKDGRMYFGGLNGVNAFYPSERFLEREYEHPDRILLTTFSKYDGFYDSIVSKYSGFDKKQTISLDFRDKFFSFDFALTNYEQPQKNIYSYKLEGYDNEWSTPSTVNTARYNNIPAGDYIFKVRSATGNGRWSEDELGVKVHVEEAFYKTWWFVTLCILLLSAMLYIVQQYRIRAIRKRQVELERLVKERTIDLEKEKKKSEDLLHNILPEETARELLEFGKAKAKRHEQVSVLFTDFKDFSGMAEQMEPEKLVSEIDYCFKAFDEIMEMYDLEKIKTIGDAYMCAGGLPIDNEDNAELVVKAALEIQAFMNAMAMEREGTNQLYFKARIGIHTGSVVSGIVGIKKFAYDIWGDTVNIAARMETSGEVGKVNISHATYELVKDKFNCVPRGEIEVKNKGHIRMYFVESIKQVANEVQA